jgi:putative ABC transport system permease protein
MLISADLANRVSLGESTIEERAVTIVGVLPDGSMAGVADRWVLIDARFMESVTEEAFDPSWLLATVEGDAAIVADDIRAAVKSAYPDYGADAVIVSDAQTALEAAKKAPVIAGLDLALALAAIVALALSALTVVVASVAAAASRHRNLSVLRMLGMSRRQAGALVLWEIAPVAITAIVAGTALGLALPWLVTSAVDLSAFVGGSIKPLPVVDPLAVTVTVLGFALVASLAGVVAMMIGRRLDPNRFLRIGSDG